MGSSSRVVVVRPQFVLHFLHFLFGHSKTCLWTYSFGHSPIKVLLYLAYLTCHAEIHVSSPHSDHLLDIVLMLSFDVLF